MSNKIYWICKPFEKLNYNMKFYGLNLNTKVSIIVNFVKNKFKLDLGWAPQVSSTSGSPKLFYSFNLVDVLKFQSVKMNFYELWGIFLKTYIENIVQ